MKPSTITQTYIHVFIGIGVITTAVGLFLLASNVVKQNALPDYPLENWEENRCEQYFLKTPPSFNDPMTGDLINPTQPRSVDELAREQIQEERYERCMRELDADREERAITDMFNAITVLLIGVGILGSHVYLNLHIHQGKHRQRHPTEQSSHGQSI